jgi:preprotein translocase subunit SecG
MGILSVLILIVCSLLVLAVLVQNSKGGGLAGNFSPGNQIMGVRRTKDFMEKATWGLAGALLILSLLSAPVLSAS